MLLIFYFSAQNTLVSSSLSGHFIERFLACVYPVFKDLSLIGQQEMVAGLQTIVRKAAHLITYLILGILCVRALFLYQISEKRRFALAQILCTVYAVSDELHQLFISGREPRMTDVLIDSVGALIGILVVNLVYRCNRIIAV